MRAMDRQAALRMMTVFSGAVKGMAFYPPAHPAIRQPLLELDATISTALSRCTTLSWGVVDGIMFFEDQLIIAPSAAIADLINRLTEKNIGRITFTSGMTIDELQQFAQLFSLKSSAIDEIRSGLKQARYDHILLARQGEESFDSRTEDEPGEEAEGNYLATYGNALDAIRGVCRDIEEGRIPSSAPVRRVVDRMVTITLQDPSTLLGLSMIKDYDNYTFNHCVNVGVLAMALGATLGLDAPTVRDLGIAGQLHDIGKTRIPKNILNKPGKLSSIEFEEMKRHPELGAGIIREMEGLSPLIAQIVLGHHLFFNRNGYPDWARSLPGNRLIDIIAVADTYDAITTLRVYQHPITPRAALDELQKQAGSLLDDKLVASFLKMMGKYPVGTLVRLDSNEVAVIYRPNPLDEDTPLVRVLFAADGTRLKLPREVPLVEPDGSRYASIVAVIDPLLKNVDVGRSVVRADYLAEAG
jgi:HD-GYP domain-containing protein (c-di-GMP phosphodiesterase class II)